MFAKKLKCVRLTVPFKKLFIFEESPTFIQSEKHYGDLNGTVPWDLLL